MKLARAAGREPVDSPSGSSLTFGLPLPRAGDLAGSLQPIQRWIKRSFLKLQQSAPTDFKPTQNLKPMGGAFFQRRQDQHFQMPAQLVAIDRTHVDILDRLVL